jgi:hypothetical protein
VVPVQTAHTNADRIRQDRLQAHAVEAAEQCGATFLPEVAELVALDRLLVVVLLRLMAAVLVLLVKEILVGLVQIPTFQGMVVAVAALEPVALMEHQLLEEMEALERVEMAFLLQLQALP